MTTPTPQDIMLAAAVVLALATLCQVVAPYLRIPALILLLPAGFLLGLVAPQMSMDAILGPAFPVAVDLMVALILFQGGLELGNIKLQGQDRSVVRRLIWIGAPITWLAGSVVAHYLLGLSWSLALLLGAILIVSGPTVVTPILDFARPQRRIRGILLWEGTMLDPIGGIFAVVVFQVVQVSDSNGPVDAFLALLQSFAVAIIVAAAGVALCALGAKLTQGNLVLGTSSLLGTVLVSAAFANYLADGSGLLTALLIGIAAQRVAKRMHASLDPVLPFFNTVASFGIGVLFVSIAALVPSPLVASIALPAIGMALILILLVRPLVATLCTGWTDLTVKERGFIAWMDPRGIVAAATASSVGASLVAAKVPGAEELLPAAFIIIAVTVTVYGLTAVPVAKALGVREPEPAASP
ncbi:MAG: cation:proton antiporter [bacterium]